MKLYIVVSTKEKVQWHNLHGIVDYLDIGINGYSVISIKAFTKKKYAKKFMQEKKMEKHLYIKAVEVL